MHEAETAIESFLISIHAPREGSDVSAGIARRI